MARLTIQQAHGQALKHQQAGQLREAQTLYQLILQQRPDHSDSLLQLGLIAHQTGQLDAAIELFRQTISQNPSLAISYNHLGNALKDKGQIVEAIESYRQALALNPKSAQTLNNLAIALKAMGLLDDAIAALRNAISLEPSYAQAHNNLGNLLAAKGIFDEAIIEYQSGLRINPNLPLVHNNLGVALLEKRQFADAIDSFRKSIALKPDFAGAYMNLGIAEKSVGAMDDALLSFRRAIGFQADLPEANCNMGSILRDTGEVSEAIAAFRRAIKLRPVYAEAHSNLLLCLHYAPGSNPSEIAAEHRRWEERCASPLAPHNPYYGNDRNPDRRLRIGYVSPDFCNHAVARFLLSLLKNHDRRIVEIFAYAEVRTPDAVTQLLSSHVDGWRSIVGIGDAQACDLIRRDQIDILIDLAGHTANNRLLIFARKPAPVQVTYLGYPDTTGLSVIDYRFTDSFADPPGQTEQYHAEKLVRLSPSAWAFEGDPNLPLPERPIAHQNQPVTFGSFNTFAKVTEPMLALWSQLMHAVPGSRLLLKSAGLSSGNLREKVKQRFTEVGIGSDRLDLRGQDPTYGQHMARYGEMDIALDTFPYHGTTTTCEALWMGVPVISLAGTTHVSRVGVSLLNNVGLPELIADTAVDYVRIAVALAGDRSRLAELHATLRQRMRQSPLMDARKLAQNVENAYRQMWHEWLKTPIDPSPKPTN